MKKLNPQTLTVILKVGVFVFLAIAGLFLFGTLFQVFGSLQGATLASFATAAAANALAMEATPPDLADRTGSVAAPRGTVGALEAG